jgi:hypothetical protein
VNFVAMGVECSSAAVQPRSTEAEWEGLLAMCQPSQATRLTTSACQEREHHGFATRDFENISTYALNDSRAFVSEHDWLWHRVALVTCNQICVAQAVAMTLIKLRLGAEPPKFGFRCLRAAFFAHDDGFDLCCVFAHRRFLLS